jgi:hypothetical protein
MHLLNIGPNIIAMPLCASAARFYRGASKNPSQLTGDSNQMLREWLRRQLPYLLVDFQSASCFSSSIRPFVSSASSIFRICWMLHLLYNGPPEKYL